MGDGTGNNDNLFRPNAPSSTIGGGEIPNISAPSARFHQKMLGVQSRLKHGSRHQPIGSYEGASNGVDAGHYLGMRQQMSPAMMMNDNSAPYPTSNPPMFANNSDNHYSLHPPNNDFQPEKIQMPQRGRQERGHQQQQRLTRSLPTTLQHDSGLLHDHNSNTHQLSQSLPQFPTVQQSLEALTVDVQRQEMESEQHQSNEFQSEKIQLLPSRGLQEERGRQQRLTRSLPNTAHYEHNNGRWLHGSNTHQLSQWSLSQYQVGQQSLEALRASTHGQELELEQPKNKDFQPEKIQMFPSRGMHERGGQQKLTRSLPNTAHYEHNNGGWLHRSNTDSLSQSLPQFQVGQESLEALRADVQRQELELEQLAKQAGNSYSSSVPSSTIQPSSTSLFPSQIQKQPTRLPSDQLFHREDPLGFCFNGTTDDNKKSPFVPAPVNWQQQNLQQPEQVATSSNNIIAQAPREADRKPVFPSPLSQSKRRRLDSDQIDRMMHMFLSDSIIESPGQLAGNDLLGAAATSSLDDGLDSEIPDLPLRDDGNVSMNSESEGDDDETQLLVSDDKKSDPDKKDATPKDTSNHIVTPSTATIAKLTAEIRSQAMKQDEQKKEERASSPSNETQVSSSSASEPNQDKPTISTTIVARLAEIMEASQTSQQNIHDWDRKMGLKRAHSKTMRESCRSRKKVLDLLKAAIDEGKELTLPTVQENRASVETDDIDAMTAVQEGDQESLSSSSSHSSGEKDEEDQEMDMSIAEEVKDVDDDELARMFRRASLECAEGITGEGTSIVLQRARQTSSESSASCSDKSVRMTPLHEETDLVQYPARCA